MTIEQMMSAMEDIINSDEVVSIPGLELEPVAENYVNTYYKPQLDACEDEKEREELRKKWVGYYTEGDGRTMIQMEMVSVESNYATAKGGLESITTSVSQQIASNAVPSVLTVGAATSAPNPAYTALDNSQKKEALKAQLKTIGNAIVELLKSAVSIAFPIPDSVGVVIETFKTTKQVVDSIP